MYNKKLYYWWLQNSNDMLVTLKKNNNISPLTGTVAETVMDSVLIPANSLRTDDIIRITYSTTKSGTAGTGTIKLRVHTSVAVGGTVISTGAPGATSLWYKGQKDLVFKNSLSSQVVYNSTDTTSLTDITNTTAAKTSLSLDFTVDQYIIITYTLGNSADTATVESWTVNAIR